MSLILLIADGARFDTIDNATREAALPALTRLRAEGGLYPITTVFPSVTGIAYAPFLTGRFPGPIGLPGLRWFDRSHTRCTRSPWSRSYLGAEMRHLDGDLDPHTPTIFELAPSRFNAMCMLGRGTGRAERIGRDARTLLRAARVHWGGSVRGWIDLDRHAMRASIAHIVRKNPAFTCIALLGLDKASHSETQTGPRALEALRVIDESVAQLRDALERAGTWGDTTLWIVSDHGHSDIANHDDIAYAIAREQDVRVLAHPWLFTRAPDVAVMVSGNAMAQLYLELGSRTRFGWESLRERWEPLARALLARESVDLLMLPVDATRTELWSRTRGGAIIECSGRRYSYLQSSGDPLGVGRDLVNVDASQAHDALADGDYPDAVVQIAQLSSGARAGDIILSAKPGWDFREKWEPIPHVSTHGSLHRDHMRVPLLVNRPITGTPRRTTDIVPSALELLGLPAMSGLDGSSFL